MLKVSPIYLTSYFMCLQMVQQLEIGEEFEITTTGEIRTFEKWMLEEILQHHPTLKNTRTLAELYWQTGDTIETMKDSIHTATETQTWYLVGAILSVFLTIKLISE